jgi:hypothetical protein
MGGVLSVLPILVAHFFGRFSFPTVVKFLAVFMMLQGIGPYSMGKSMDLKDTYDFAYYIFIVLNFVAAGLVLSMRKPRMSED